MTEQAFCFLPPIFFAHSQAQLLTVDVPVLKSQWIESAAVVLFLSVVVFPLPVDKYNV